MASLKSVIEEIVNEVTVEDLKGGVIFETRPSSPTLKDDILDEQDNGRFLEELDKQINLQCLSLEDDASSDIGDEPFDALAAKMFNLIQSGKIKKRIIRQGYGETPEEGAEVKIHYNGYLQFEAHPFDSSYARKTPFTFTVGEGQCISGLDIAVASMKINEKSHFLIDPEFAYKDSGLNRIPANSTILFEIELLDKIKSDSKPNSDDNNRDFSKVYDVCLACLVTGRQKFERRDFSGAVRDYETAIRKLENAILNDYNDQLKCDELLCKLYSNALVCFTHLEQPKRGCSCANKIYEMARNGTVKVPAKVYFNNAKCLRALRDFNLAEKRLAIAKRMEPRNAKIDEELASLRSEREDFKKRDQAFARRSLNL